MHIHGSTEGPLLIVSLVVTSLFVLGEAIAGYAAHSLALISDAGHNASDALALGLAAYAIWVAKKPANAKNTYGYHRVAILTALFNAVSLVIIGVIILVEAFELLRNPAPVVGSLMIVVAGISVLMNTVIAKLLSAGAKTSLNMRAAYIHMAGDALSAAAVVVAGFVVRSTGWVYADPLASALIGLFILYSAWGIVRESVSILLESTPRSVDLDRMVAAMETVPTVNSVHDVHVWTVSDGMHYLSCHVELPEGSSIEQVSNVVGQLNELLAHDYGIAHATIQAEVEGTCLNNPRFCG
jgi:cobalt-zinc-cadmium efflux system protein